MTVTVFKGRPLETWEVVHHKNGNGKDNRLENLALLPADAHMLITMTENARIAELEAQIVGLKAELERCRDR